AGNENVEPARERDHRREGVEWHAERAHDIGAGAGERHGDDLRQKLNDHLDDDQGVDQGIGGEQTGGGGERSQKPEGEIRAVARGVQVREGAEETPFDGGRIRHTRKAEHGGEDGREGGPEDEDGDDDGGGGSVNALNEVAHDGGGMDGVAPWD